MTRKLDWGKVQFFRVIRAFRGFFAVVWPAAVAHRSGGYFRRV
jgi:hypothetical protein